jgi:hypothetical protein
VNLVTSEQCDICKTETKRCEYYPKGRSRKHGKCLECDAKDPQRPEGYKSRDPRYCYECDRACVTEKNIRAGVPV